jgi:hypothetical protein
MGSPTTGSMDAPAADAPPPQASSEAAAAAGAAAAGAAQTANKHDAGDQQKQQQPPQAKAGEEDPWPSEAAGPWSSWGVLDKQEKAVSALRFSHDGALLAAACKWRLAAC